MILEDCLIKLIFLSLQCCCACLLLLFCWAYVSGYMRKHALYVQLLCWCSTGMFTFVKRCLLAPAKYCENVGPLGWRDLVRPNIVIIIIMLKKTYSALITIKWPSAHCVGTLLTTRTRTRMPILRWYIIPTVWLSVLADMTTASTSRTVTSYPARRRTWRIRGEDDRSRFLLRCWHAAPCWVRRLVSCMRAKPYRFRFGRV